MFKLGFLIISAFLFIQCVALKTESKIVKNINWAEETIWYQVFPERFRNGNLKNDPTINEVPNANLQLGWQVHPWTSDWYKIQPWEKKKSDKFYDVVFERRYGGDLAGVIGKLNYLKNLGINGIYFNPVFEAQSLHKYDGASFHHIDDNFGNNPETDKKRLLAANETDEPQTWINTSADSVFFKLIQEAHKRDIRIVIDGVFNHSGPEFFAFEDVTKNGPKSRYADWYDIKKWDDPNTPENEFDFAGWWGFKGLPEFYEDENGFHKGVWDYIFAATKKWMDPNNDGDPSDGIDGWRLDVSDQVKPIFWRAWYKHVKSINPAALIVAENWSDASEALKDNQFDSAMNYPFAYAMVEFFINDKKRISGAEVARRFNQLKNNYGEERLRKLWNLIDSHDTDRIASMVLNPDLNFDRNRSPRDNPAYLVRKPTKNERTPQKLIAAFQATFIGAPMFYYGTEAGMWGTDDPDDRKPMLWRDMNFENEKTHPLPGRQRPDDVNKFDEELFSYYQSLIQMRKANPALMHGSFDVLDVAVTENTFGFIRAVPGQKLVVIFNRSASQEKIKLISGGGLKDIFSGKRFESNNNHVRINLRPQSFLVLQ
jgi:cyclomaltodextrinase / maltogenic alpha-amylase / neopullulanase